MNRRKFFKIATPLAATPLVLGGTPIRTFANQQLLQNTLNCDGVSERIMVIIHLKGGNDGLNTLVPIEQYNTYVEKRPNLALPDSGLRSYIPLDNTLPLDQQVGLHPEMSAFKSLYEDGKVNIIQNVGYSTPNLSHFKSSELWYSGGDGTPANSEIATGWMGRYLNKSYAGYTGVPSANMPDPLGIQLGDSKPSYGFLSDSEFSMAVNLTGQDPSGLYNQLTEIGTAPMATVPESQYGRELQYAMGLQNSMSLYAQRITTVFAQGTNSHNNYDPYSDLANQLKTVAKLVSGGCKTKIYLLQLGGFDTHADQSETGDSTIGRHATLMKELSEAVKFFQDDLSGLGLEDKVLTLTFSEFGRKATENGALGTDHGTVAPMFIFGTSVNAGMIGSNPNLANANNSGQYADELQFDYRQVYTTLLQDWLGASDSVIEETQFNPYLNSKVPFIRESSIVDPACYLTNILPIELTSFKAEVVDNDKVALKWQTATEINNAFFIIERSKDGITFEDLFEVPGAGNSNIPLNYSEMDETPLPGTSYYRLKQVDFDGTESTHNIEVVTLIAKEGIIVEMYPNPADRFIQVGINVEKSEKGNISVYDMSGRLIKSVKVDVYIGYNKIPLNVSDIPNGQYAVQIRLDSGYFYTSKHVIRR